MAREDLSDRLKVAGRELLDMTDALDMQAQGAMWILNRELGDWRYYLVTSLVYTIGRRSTYALLLRAFEKTKLPEEMTIHDVHLGSPTDELFRRISYGVDVDDATATVRDCLISGVPFDGVIYRSVSEEPSLKQAHRLKDKFIKKVKGLSKNAS